MMRFLFVLVGLLALAAVAAPAIWLAHWVVIGLVIWGVASLLRGPRPPRRWERMHYYGPARPLPPRPPRPPRPVRAPARSSRPADLPLDVQVKAEQIRRKAEVLLEQRDRFPLGSEDLYIVRATLDDYLPRTMNAFLAVPPTLRERVMPRTGKTPLQEVTEQLGLLDTKLDEVAEDLQRHNYDRLLNNRRFLEERFSRVA